MWPLFAVRSVWVAILLIGIGLLVLWFFFRVMGDLVHWFQEEILDDYRELRKQPRPTTTELEATQDKSEEEEALPPDEPV